MRICISSSKGGSGKSTTALNLAAAYAIEGKSVRIIDADPQGSINDWAGVRPEDMTMPFEVIAAPRKTIARDIDSLSGDAEIVIIDTPGRDDVIALSAMGAADLVLIPVTGSSFDLWGAETTLSNLERVQALNPDIQAAMMHSRAVVGSKLTSEMSEAMGDLDIQPLSSIICSRVSIARSADGKTVFESKDKKAIAEYIALAEEIDKLVSDN